MKIIRSCIVAFSMYSKIPMPQFEWKDDDMKYMLVFFPWVGAVIGILLGIWRMACGFFDVGALCYTAIGCLIPVIITGGFHIDGFMDTMDAFHSYQPRERKLEILKDSHIGAFAVIMLMAYGLLYAGAFSEIDNDRIFGAFCVSFFFARCLSGIAVVTFKSAKSDGLLFMFADSAQKNIVKVSLYVQLVLSIAIMLWLCGLSALVMVAAGFLSFWYYHYRSVKELGGITGDTAGYFVAICECAMAVAAAACGFAMRI